MHKGRIYELNQDARVWCGEYPYPYWAPKAWVMSACTYAGTQASRVVNPNPTLNYVGRYFSNGVLSANYGANLYFYGPSDYANLYMICQLQTPDHAIRYMLTFVNGVYTCPFSFDYRDDFPFDPLSKFYTGSGTPGELILRPTHLAADPKPY
jgi:hypothetical protein